MNENNITGKLKKESDWRNSSYFLSDKLFFQLPVSTKGLYTTRNRNQKRAEKRDEEMHCEKYGQRGKTLAGREGAVTR